MVIVELSVYLVYIQGMNNVTESWLSLPKDVTRASKGQQISSMSYTSRPKGERRGKARRHAKNENSRRRGRNTKSRKAPASKWVKRKFDENEKLSKTSRIAYEIVRNW